MTIEEVVAECGVSNADVLAASSYAARLVAAEEVRAVKYTACMLLDEDMHRSAKQASGQLGYEVLVVFELSSSASVWQPVAKGRQGRRRHSRESGNPVLSPISGPRVRGGDDGGAFRAPAPPAAG
jgi:hypothetical protein